MTKTFIFAGGKATRFNNGKPGPLKPILKICNKTILEYIFDIYSNHGCKDFYLLSGYKHDKLVTFSEKFRNKNINVKVIYSGLNTQTGGRLSYIKKFVKSDESFFVTYGDSLANFNLKKALKLKKKNNFIISTYDYALPYGTVDIANSKVLDFKEKKETYTINAGFYIFDNDIFKLIKKKSDRLEVEVFQKLIMNMKTKKLIPFKVTKWYPIDDNEKLKKAKDLLKKNRNFFLK